MSYCRYIVYTLCLGNLILRVKYRGKTKIVSVPPKTRRVYFEAQSIVSGARVVCRKVTSATCWGTRPGKNKPPTVRAKSSVDTRFIDFARYNLLGRRTSTEEAVKSKKEVTRGKSETFSFPWKTPLQSTPEERKTSVHRFRWKCAKNIGTRVFKKNQVINLPHTYYKVEQEWPAEV